MPTEPRSELTPGQWQRLQSLFAVACTMSTPERDALISDPVVDDELRAHLVGMLASDAEAGDRLERVVHSAARAASPADPWIGRRLGPYRIVRELGRGGMGVVFDAVREDYQKRVAIKVAPWSPDAARIRERFHQEGQILAALDHPNISRFLDAGTEDDVPYVVMEYVEGQPITDYCEGLGIAGRLALFRSVCAAVHAAHESQVVHRDLKPANILVDDKGTPKLLDFGVAKLLDPIAHSRRTAGAAPWTPDYGSPEQVRNGIVTVRSDVYSLGLLLYELLTGARAQVADTSSPIALDRSICETEPPRPSERAAALGDRIRARELRGDLDAIVMMAIRKEPERRYASVAALSDDVARVLEGRPVRARRGTAIYRAARFVRRHRVAVAAGVLFVAVGAAIAALVARAGSGDSALDPEPFLHAPAKQLTTKGRVRWVAVSPDGKSFAYTQTVRGEASESVWLAQTDGSGEIQLVPPIEGAYNALAFAPDGQAIYFTRGTADRAQAGFFRVPARGGVAQRVSERSGPIGVSPDGQRIAFSRLDRAGKTSSLVVARLDGSDEREVARRPMGRSFLTQVAWSSDGTRLASAAVTDAATDSREIFVVSLADRRIEQLTSRGWTVMSNLAWLPNERLVAVAADRRDIDRRLWLIAYPGGTARPISEHIDTYGSGLSLSPDGATLLASQLRRESNVWLAPAGDPSKARQVTFSSLNGMYGWRGLTWTPDNRIVFAGTIDHTGVLFSMDGDGRGQRQITPAGFLDQRPSVTPDGRTVVFESNRTGASEIWRVNMDGSDLRPLTAGGANSVPHLTPDGAWVIYVSKRGSTALWRVPVAGGSPARITDTDSNFPHVSPDGSLIACAYRAPGDRTRLGVVRLADGVPLELFDVPGSAQFYDGIRWTPDGRAVCYRDAANGIWRQDLNGGAPQRLEGVPAEKIYNYGWSRDGTQLAITRGREISDVVLLRHEKR